MRKIHSFILITILLGCGKNQDQDSIFSSGLWYAERGDMVWLVNDSLILFYPFYPYTKWEMSNDTLRVLDLVSLDSSVPNYFEYTFDKLNGQEAYVRFTEESNVLLKFRRISKLEKLEYLPKKLSLLISECEFEIDCVRLKIEINISDSTVSIEDVKESGQTISCKLNSQELLSIKYLTNRVPWIEIDKPLFSNEINSKYFSLIGEFEDPSQNKKVMSDTGGFAPSSIDNLIIFIWATSQLRCMPEEYNRDLFSY